MKERNIDKSIDGLLQLFQLSIDVQQQKPHYRVNYGRAFL